MSDEQTHAPQPAADEQALAPLIDIRAARYAKLLFGEGEDGWDAGTKGVGTMDTSTTGGEDVFMRHVFAPDDKPFTQEDFKACLELLVEEYGIELDPLKPEQCHFTPNEMTFVISDDDMGILRDDGLGRENAGKLSDPRHAKLNELTPENDPDAVLAAQVRSHLMQRESWSNEERAHIDPRDIHADLFLPKAFLEDLAHAHGVDSLTNSAIEEMLKTAWRINFPDVSTPAVGRMDTENAVVFTFVVQDKEIPQLEEAMLGYQQRLQTPRSDGERPSATITSISTARRSSAALNQR